MKAVILKTSRLILRPPVAEDAAPLECYLSDRRVAQTTAAIPHPYPRGGALDWIATVEQRWAAGSAATFTICLRNTARQIGVISLLRGERGELSAGYWIAVPYWGLGYATEALHRVLRYAFNQLACPRVQARHFAHNPASGRVMLKAGLQFEKIIPSGGQRDGIPYDSVSYAITAAEWRASLLSEYELTAIP